MAAQIEDITQQCYNLGFMVRRLNKLKQQKKQALRVQGSRISTLRKRHLVQFRMVAANYTARELILEIKNGRPIPLNLPVLKKKMPSDEEYSGPESIPVNTFDSSYANKEHGATVYDLSAWKVDEDTKIDYSENMSAKKVSDLKKRREREAYEAEMNRRANELLELGRRAGKRYSNNPK